MTELLTADELSKALKIRRKTLWMWVRSGKIPHYRRGRRFIRFDLQEVLKTLKVDSEARSS